MTLLDFLLRIDAGMRQPEAWLLAALAGSVLTFLAATVALSRWSAEVAVWPARKVGLTIVLLLFASILAALWIAAGVLVGGPVTFIAMLLYPESSPVSRDFDFAFIYFLEFSGALGLLALFAIFPLSYCAITLRALPPVARYATLPLLVAIAVGLVAMIRGTASLFHDHWGVSLLFMVAVTGLWACYLFILDTLAKPPGAGRKARQVPFGA